jgi:hypothetical protein
VSAEGIPVEAIGEVLARTFYERSKPHGYGCDMCDVEVTEPPYHVEHEPDCEAEIVRKWLDQVTQA